MEMIVVAAGRGSRMGSEIKKQYLPLAGAPILVRTLQTLSACPLVDRVVLVVSPEDIEYVRGMVGEHEIDKIGDVVAGGPERQDSVWQGLRATLPNCTHVAIHDAARPLVSQDEIIAVIEAAMDGGAATLGVPVKDTIKRVKDGLVSETLERASLWAVHTPQAFRRDWLEEAHRRSMQAGGHGTDDASLVERAGYPVQMVQGSYENLKITTPEDLLVAETLFQERLRKEQTHS
ncbi:MAG: 2-C-methyl-D-erythritol 4-phosphate cytidylyltransferase [Tumebacillaceae bacterium]